MPRTRAKETVRNYWSLTVCFKEEPCTQKCARDKERWQGREKEEDKGGRVSDSSDILSKSLKE